MYTVVVEGGTHNCILMVVLLSALNYVTLGRFVRTWSFLGLSQCNMTQSDNDLLKNINRNVDILVLASITIIPC